MKKKILVTLNIIAALVMAVAACSVDTEGYTALAVFAICAGWLLLSAYANGYMEVERL